MALVGLAGEGPADEHVPHHGHVLEDAVAVHRHGDVGVGLGAVRDAGREEEGAGRDADLAALVGALEGVAGLRTDVGVVVEDAEPVRREEATRLEVGVPGQDAAQEAERLAVVRRAVEVLVGVERDDVLPEVDLQVAEELVDEGFVRLQGPEGPVVRDPALGVGRAGEVRLVPHAEVAAHRDPGVDLAVERLHARGNREKVEVVEDVVRVDVGERRPLAASGLVDMAIAALGAGTDHEVGLGARRSRERGEHERHQGAPD